MPISFLRKKFFVKSKPTKRKASARRLSVENLEDRIQPAVKTITVNTGSDVGANDTVVSFREALESLRTPSVNGVVTHNNVTFNALDDIVINFGIPGAAGSVQRIAVTQALPVISNFVAANSVTINGYSQNGFQENTLATGFNAAIKVEIDGSGLAGADNVGLRISAKNGDVTVRGLSIYGFSGAAIDISGAGQNQTVVGTLDGLPVNNSELHFVTISGNVLGASVAGDNGFQRPYGIRSRGEPCDLSV